MVRRPPRCAQLVAARVAYVISGGTGSGKTTLLTALLGGVTPTSAVVLIEDANELPAADPHGVAAVEAGRRRRRRWSGHGATSWARR